MKKTGGQKSHDTLPLINWEVKDYYKSRSRRDFKDQKPAKKKAPPKLVPVPVIAHLRYFKCLTTQSSDSSPDSKEKLDPGKKQKARNKA